MFKPTTSNRNLIESIILLLLLLAIMFAVYDVVKAFFGVFTFALIFAVSFSRPYEHLVKLLKGKRKLAAVIYVVVLVSIVTLPFIYIASAISHHLREAIYFVTHIKEFTLAPLPVWVVNLPLIGGQINVFWDNILLNPQKSIAPYEIQLKKSLHHLLTAGTGMLGATFQFILGIIVSSFFLFIGHKILLPVKAAMKHLLGAKEGIELLNASGQAIKGVSIGVMGSALIASVICWIGFTIAAVPFPLVLAALVFFLVLIQVGPLLVWIPLIIWYSTLGHTGWTIFLIIYAICMMVIETLLKPILIAKSGGELPFLVLFVGVVGGLMAWGFTGMFKGAIIMAVFYTIFTTWLKKRKLEQDLLSEISNRKEQL